jgi:type I restriction enzyme S subunit
LINFLKHIYLWIDVRLGTHEIINEKRTGYLLPRNVNAWYTETGENSSLKSVFHKDDVLFGKLRAYLQKYWFANRTGVCSTEIWVLMAIRSLLIPRFIFQLVKVDSFVEVARTAYGTHMPRSDWNVVKNYEVPLPPIVEQEVIATILSDMDAEIATLETKLAKTRQLKQGMMHNLLTGRIRLVQPSQNHDTQNHDDCQHDAGVVW